MSERYAYISGALTNLPEEKRDKIKRFYEMLGKACGIYGLPPYIPHQHSDPKTHAHLSPHDVYRIDEEKVTKSTLLVACLVMDSYGVGGELVIARYTGVPTVILTPKELLDAKRISRFPRGVTSIIHEIVYAEEDDAIAQLNGFLKRFTESDRAEAAAAGR